MQEMELKMNPGLQIGDIIKAYRLSNMVTPGSLARAANISLHEMWAIEKNKLVPNDLLISSFSKSLNVNIHKFINTESIYMPLEKKPRIKKLFFTKKIEENIPENILEIGSPTLGRSEELDKKESFGIIVKNYRMLSGLSFDDLVKKTDLTTHELWMIENNQYIPSENILNRLSVQLDINLKQFLPKKYKWYNRLFNFFKNIFKRKKVV